MNGREAQKRGYFHAALMIESALSNGWEPPESLYPDKRDREQVEAAVIKVLDTLRSRAARGE